LRAIDYGNTTTTIAAACQERSTVRVEIREGDVYPIRNGRDEERVTIVRDDMTEKLGEGMKGR